ncbi:MAG: tryptophan synthase subunit alpha [Vicinamibacterales bacterium]|jgi:tryptophan synthase alpha chain|nr:tryptophan synthase subunit alpha [Acidobacteriota bacterium]MDP7671980.1 tryptophan synthase subunit alpha [Vicinamibacterales bacterium]HJO37197.1 tryptophan synthase subunit alpha [Vicinamibacterales bacterium]
MSRLDEAFGQIRSEKRTGLVTYVTAGDPDLVRTRSILRTLDEAGADVLEVGVPFSDPLADGPVIQRASERARAGGTTLAATLEMIGGARGELRAPVVVFSYANPILAMGSQTFAARASDAGVDGVLALDLPIEEAGDFRATMLDAGLDPIFLLSPTTSDARIKRAAELGRGFLYGISRLGVTGARTELADGAERMAARIRAQTQMPLALGFGVSTAEHVAAIGRWADAAVVGSALVSVIEKAAGDATLESALAAYVQELTSGHGSARYAEGRVDETRRLERHHGVRATDGRE